MFSLYFSTLDAYTLWSMIFSAHVSKSWAVISSSFDDLIMLQFVFF